MANRADRRKAKKNNKPKARNETNYAAFQRIMRTGEITVKDIDREYQNGYKAAMAASEQFQIPFFFGALACALKKTYGFGEERIERTFRAVIGTMNQEITAMDMIERCKRETGIDVIMFTKEEPLRDRNTSPLPSWPASCISTMIPCCAGSIRKGISPPYPWASVNITAG